MYISEYQSMPSRWKLHCAYKHFFLVCDKIPAQSALPCPLGPYMNRWAALGTSTEPAFPVSWCVGGPVVMILGYHSGPPKCNTLRPRAKC